MRGGGGEAGPAACPLGAPSASWTDGAHPEAEQMDQGCHVLNQVGECADSWSPPLCRTRWKGSLAPGPGEFSVVECCHSMETLPKYTLQGYTFCSLKAEIKLEEERRRTRSLGAHCLALGQGELWPPACARSTVPSLGLGSSWASLFPQSWSRFLNQGL